MIVKDSVKDRVKDRVKDKLDDHKLIKAKVKEAILKHLSGAPDTEFISISVTNAVDQFYVNLYAQNQKKAKELQTEIKSLLNKRQEVQDNRYQTNQDLELFQEEIKKVLDGTICSLLADQIKDCKVSLNKFTVLGGEVESLQCKLDDAIRLSTSLAVRLIERNVVTLDQIRNNRYFFKKLGENEWISRK